MKTLLFLLGISYTPLMILPCFGHNAMIKEDFSDRGFSIVLPDDPTFGSDLERLGFSVSSSAPLTVLVKNTSRRAIVAFGVRFTKRFSDGHNGTSDVVATQPSALVDLGQPNRYDRPLEGLIMPGGTRLVTTDGVVDPDRKRGTSYRTDTPWTVTKVQLDSVVFDDGEAIGPDKLDVIKRLKAHIDAQQDLMEEISERLAKGERLHDVLEDLQRTTLSETDVPEREVSAMVAISLDKVYPVVRLHYLAELLTTEANMGDEIAIRRLRQLKYATRPNIHQMGGS